MSPTPAADRPAGGSASVARSWRRARSRALHRRRGRGVAARPRSVAMAPAGRLRRARSARPAAAARAAPPRGAAGAARAAAGSDARRPERRGRGAPARASDGGTAGRLHVEFEDVDSGEVLARTHGRASGHAPRAAPGGGRARRLAWSRPVIARPPRSARAGAAARRAGFDRGEAPVVGAGQQVDLVLDRRARTAGGRRARPLDVDARPRAARRTRRSRARSAPSASRRPARDPPAAPRATACPRCSGAAAPRMRLAGSAGSASRSP